ncbi:hypothetical protein B0H16DRAFT_1456594 [Mycena metata]|uniref:Uncharacterized protein n=1 Tax=Mycena metata TaxID=1033252 RepID=A0AAD7J959_9AGAR|nr:hypothetical protein B0H16DRAFT_1456594 [Mycena metata]
MWVLGGSILPVFNPTRKSCMTWKYTQGLGSGRWSMGGIFAFLSLLSTLKFSQETQLRQLFGVNCEYDPVPTEDLECLCLPRSVNGQDADAKVAAKEKSAPSPNSDNPGRTQLLESPRLDSVFEKSDPLCNFPKRNRSEAADASLKLSSDLSTSSLLSAPRSSLSPKFAITKTVPRSNPVVMSAPRSDRLLVATMLSVSPPPPYASSGMFSMPELPEVPSTPDGGAAEDADWLNARWCEELAELLVKADGLIKERETECELQFLRVELEKMQAWSEALEKIAQAGTEKIAQAGTEKIIDEMWRKKEHEVKFCTIRKNGTAKRRWRHFAPGGFFTSVLSPSSSVEFPQDAEDEEGENSYGAEHNRVSALRNGSYCRKSRSNIRTELGVPHSITTKGILDERARQGDIVGSGAGDKVEDRGKELVSGRGHRSVGAGYEERGGGAGKFIEENWGHKVGASKRASVDIASSVLSLVLVASSRAIKNEIMHVRRKYESTTYAK